MRTIRLLIPLFAIALIVAACGSAAEFAPLPNAGAPVDVSSGSAGSLRTLGGASAAPAAPSNQGGDGVDPAAIDPAAIAPRDDASIIRTGSIELEVSDAR